MCPITVSGIHFQLWLLIPPTNVVSGRQKKVVPAIHVRYLDWIPNSWLCHARGHSVIWNSELEHRLSVSLPLKLINNFLERFSVFSGFCLGFTSVISSFYFSFLEWKCLSCACFSIIFWNSFHMPMTGRAFTSAYIAPSKCMWKFSLQGNGIEKWFNHEDPIFTDEMRRLHIRFWWREFILSPFAVWEQSTPPLGSTWS